MSRPAGKADPSARGIIFNSVHHSQGTEGNAMCRHNAVGPRSFRRSDWKLEPKKAPWRAGRRKGPQVFPWSSEKKVYRSAFLVPEMFAAAAGAGKQGIVRR
jgi:hypothetical protein